jgi:hypothetical protein
VPLRFTFASLPAAFVLSLLSMPSLSSVPYSSSSSTPFSAAFRVSSLLIPAEARSPPLADPPTTLLKASSWSILKLFYIAEVASPPTLTSLILGISSNKSFEFLFLSSSSSIPKYIFCLRSSASLAYLSLSDSDGFPEPKAALTGSTFFFSPQSKPSSELSQSSSY